MKESTVAYSWKYGPCWWKLELTEHPAVSTEYQWYNPDKHDKKPDCPKCDADLSGQTKEEKIAHWKSHKVSKNCSCGSSDEERFKVKTPRGTIIEVCEGCFWFHEPWFMVV